MFKIFLYVAKQAILWLLEQMLALKISEQNIAQQGFLFMLQGNTSEFLGKCTDVYHY